MVNIKKVIKRSLIVGSILIGVSPLLMKANLFKKKNEKSSSLLPLQLTGDWTTADKAFILRIYPDPSLSINGTKLALKLHSAVDDDVFLQDQYGYGITVKRLDSTTLEVFDEAEDEKHIFYKA